jgi:hypothetical protein
MKPMFVALAAVVVAGCGVASLRVPSITVDPDVPPRAESLREPPRIAVKPLSLATGLASPNEIGQALTGLNDRRTTVISDEPVDAIVTRAVARGFEAAGFQLVGEDQADLILEGEILSFWASEGSTEHKQHSKASVLYDLRLVDPPRGAIWSNTIRSFKASEGVIETTGRDVQTLAAALKESVESIFLDPKLWGALSDR